MGYIVLQGQLPHFHNKIIIASFVGSFVIYEKWELYAQKILYFFF